MARILIVDDDGATRSAIAASLRRPHRVVATASDGDEALYVVASFSPQLVITDIAMPHMSGWELIDRLRAYPNTALTSVIVTTAHDEIDDRLRALRSGAVDFLAKPFALEELELRVENALRSVSIVRRVSDVPSEDGFAGNLATLPLASLLGMLATDRKSGELRIALGNEEVRLLLRDGAIVRARFTHGRSTSGVECVFDVLAWDEGRFGFIEHDVVEGDEIRTPMMALLVEAARRADEAARTDREAS